MIRRLSLAILHSAVSALLFVSIYSQFDVGANVSRNEILPVLLILLASIVLYLRTGVPGMVSQECRSCGETVSVGRLRCENCGTSTDSVRRKLMTAEGIWFLVGYTSLLVLWLSVAYRVEPIVLLFPAYFAVVILYSWLLFSASQIIRTMVQKS